MELNISGIKCDTRHCNYRDDSVKFDDYLKWINKPCPLCNSNLLTIKDYNSCVRMKNIIKLINVLKWINPIFYIKSVYRLLTGKKKEYDNLDIKYENDGSITKRIYK